MIMHRRGELRVFEQLLIFYAPFLVVFASIAAAFWLAPMDNAVKGNGKRGQR